MGRYRDALLRWRQHAMWVAWVEVHHQLGYIVLAHECTSNTLTCLFGHLRKGVFRQVVLEILLVLVLPFIQHIHHSAVRLEELSEGVLRGVLCLRCCNPIGKSS